MDELITKVEQWAKDKGLDQADSSKQMLKTIEEIGEVAASLARKDEHGLRDGIGDVVVTLIILAMQNDMDLYECLNQAYNEIKGRTGKMVDGVFVKSSGFGGSGMKYEIPLSEEGIQAIINGREVNIELPDGTELVIRQSYLKDMAAPVLIDRFNVTDSVVENHLKEFRSSIDDTFRLGS